MSASDVHMNNRMSLCCFLFVVSTKAQNITICDNVIIEKKHTLSYYPEVVHDQEIFLNSMN